MARAMSPVKNIQDTKGLKEIGDGEIKAEIKCFILGGKVPNTWGISSTTTFGF